MAKVRYFVDDVDAAINFYVQHLGFESVFNAGQFAMISKGDLTLWISPNPPKDGLGDSP